MSFETLLATCQKLNAQAETLAAIGAEIQIRNGNLNPDPTVHALIKDVVNSVDPNLFADVTKAQEATALSFITSFFRQTLDLLENPARSPGWIYTDPIILNQLGQVSRVVVRAIEALAKQRPDLSASLSGTGTFLDVGTGTGWIAIEGARTWPTLKFTGIDPWEPALSIARENLAASTFANRVALKLQGVQALQDEGKYTVIWYPSPFITESITRASMPILMRALAPGGTLVFGLFAPAPTSTGEALAKLRIVRGGGYRWSREQAMNLLSDLDLKDIAFFESGTPAQLVVGRKT